MSAAQICGCCGQTIDLETLVVDAETFTVQRGGRRVRLRPQQFRLLAALRAAAPSPVDGTDLLQAVADRAPGEAMPGYKLVEVIVCHLRKALRGTGVVVETIGRSYALRFTAPEQEGGEASAQGRRSTLCEKDLVRVEALRRSHLGAHSIAMEAGLTAHAARQALKILAAREGEADGRIVA